MSQYFSMSPEEKTAFEQSQRPVYEVNEVATRVLQVPMLRLEKAAYAPNNGQISLHWLDSRFVEAFASSRPGANIDHIIAISYPMVSTLWRDSISFGNYASRLFGADTEDEVKAIFDLYKTSGRMLKPQSLVLPDGVTFEQCVDTTFSLGLTWLFYHEASHLMQNHGQIRRSAMQSGFDDSQDLRVDEFHAYGNEKPLTEYQSWIWHVTELAADYEGTIYAIRTMYFQNLAKVHAGIRDTPTISWKELWMLLIAVALVFFRFWEASKRDFVVRAEGTHPHPGIRYRLIQDYIFDNFNALRVSGGAIIAVSPDQLSEIADDAFISAVMFWAARYEADESMKSSFLEVALGSRPEIKPYLSKASAVWSDVRKDAISNHLIPSDRHVMDLSDDLSVKFSSIRRGYV